MEEQLRQIAQYILLGVGINATALLGIMGGIIYLVVHFTRFAREMERTNGTYHGMFARLLP
jgi:hypothetical protein